jgi:hypothetical protein
VKSTAQYLVKSHTLNLYVTCAVIAGVSVGVHVTDLSWGYLGDLQLLRHNAVLQGTAGDPWQYRILSEHLLRPVVYIFGVLGIDNHESYAFVLFRYVQCFLAGILAHRWYVRLGYSYGTALFGVALLGIAFSSATYDSDLSFNTYMDIIFYLLSALIMIESRHIAWLILLVPIAVTNRETALLIPVLAIIIGGLRVWRPAVFALSLGIISLITLRWHYGGRPLITAYGNEPGLDLLLYNLRYLTIQELAKTCGLIFILALVGWRSTGGLERKMLLLLGAPWLVIHAISAVLAETRLLLVPIVLVLVPVALTGLDLDKPKGSWRWLTRRT